jgi:hypothetical protein
VAAAIASALLTGWIAVEMAILRQPTTPTSIELLYLAIGLTGLVLAPALRR